MSTKTFYMHTIDGRPGQFQPSFKQVSYAGRHCGRLATSLEQIRREQKIDQDNKSPNSGPYELGYIRIPASAFLK